MVYFLEANISLQISRIYSKNKKSPSLEELFLFGGAKGIRTPDPLTASQVRSQLRYSPKVLEYSDIVA